MTVDDNANLELYNAQRQNHFAGAGVFTLFDNHA